LREAGEQQRVALADLAEAVNNLIFSTEEVDE
jgi:predicted ABC-type transport system involved in lysophospholipase L1 biosynthesis ATPase subunit